MIVLEIFGSMAYTLLVAGNRIVITGFSSFEIREYEGYTGRNTKTGNEGTNHRYYSKHSLNLMQCTYI